MNLHILTVAGSLHRSSVTRVVLADVAARLRASDCTVDEYNLAADPLPLLDTDTGFGTPAHTAARARVQRADVLILGSPDYHGGVSGVLKNFLDHFWKEFAGKLLCTVVASHEKGLTVHDQLRTLARQCQAWSLPYGVSFEEKQDVRDGAVASDALRARLEMFARDTRVYGALLAQQRHADLAGQEPGMMARLRK